MKTKIEGRIIRSCIQCFCVMLVGAIAYQIMRWSDLDRVLEVGNFGLMVFSSSIVTLLLGACLHHHNKKTETLVIVPPAQPEVLFDPNLVKDYEKLHFTFRAICETYNDWESWEEFNSPAFHMRTRIGFGLICALNKLPVPQEYQTETLFKQLDDAITQFRAIREKETK